METPVTSPLPYPSKTIFQSTWVPGEPCSEVEGAGGAGSEFPHGLDKGLPHNPGFPSNELFGYVPDCLISLSYRAHQRVMRYTEELKECELH